MLNIVLPIAGKGSRFRDAGYDLPKPLIPVHGKPMIEVVVQNLKPRMPHRFIFAALAEHLETSDLRSMLEHAAPGCVIIPVSTVTQGQACSVLLAKDYINTDEPLMTANCDQWIDIDINDYLDSMAKVDADGIIMTMKATDPKWSFAKVGSDGFVIQTAEKIPISDDATVGIYNFKRGKDFVRAAEAMIEKNLRVNNEFYVCPVYNQLIAEGRKIAIYNVGSEGNGMYGLGIPQDLTHFCSLEVSRQATAFSA